MADEAALFRERAAIERRNADATDLDNVRDRCLRAEAAWTAMAERAERTRTQREEREGAAQAARLSRAAEDAAVG